MFAYKSCVTNSSRPYRTPTLLHSTASGYCLSHLIMWRVFRHTSTQILRQAQPALVYLFLKPALLLLFLLFPGCSLNHSLCVILHLPGSYPTSLHYTNMVQKTGPLNYRGTGLFACFQLLSSSWNLSLQLKSNPSFL